MLSPPLSFFRGLLDTPLLLPPTILANFPWALLLSVTHDSSTCLNFALCSAWIPSLASSPLLPAPTAPGTSRSGEDCLLWVPATLTSSDDSTETPHLSLQRCQRLRLHWQSKAVQGAELAPAGVWDTGRAPFLWQFSWTQLWQGTR